MNFGKIMLGILSLAVLGGLVFWFVGGDDQNASNATTPQDIADTQVENSQSAATPADQLPGQTTNPGAGSTETMPLTRIEVSNHNTISDCWTIVDNTVYDITTYISEFARDEPDISTTCGTTGDSYFGNNVQETLAGYELGTLEG